MLHCCAQVPCALEAGAAYLCTQLFPQHHTLKAPAWRLACALGLPREGLAAEAVSTLCERFGELAPDAALPLMREVWACDQVWQCTQQRGSGNGGWV